MSDRALDPGLAPAGALPPLSRRIVVLFWVTTVVTVIALLATAATQRWSTTTLAAVTFTLVVVAWRHILLAWPTLLGLLLAVILFIPMRRYTIAGGLPFALEPYRVFMALIVPTWLLAVLVDPQVKLRATGLEAPAACYGVVVLLSLLTNPGRVAGLSTEVVKSMTFVASFFALLYFVAGAIDTRTALDRVIKFIVIGGAIIAALTMYEWQSGHNFFNNLSQFLPGVTFHPELVPWTPGRGGRPRAYASAQHAIALGALLVMLLPLAVYLWRRSGRFVWLAVGGLLVMGALATGSRTAIVMLVVSLIMFLRYKRAQTVRMLPYLLPMLMAVQVVMPGTLGTFKASLFPSGGV
ncbi:MAG: hypothetical protein ACHQ02_08990, partial [Candidatus Limnocylindrales bacterium]